MSNSQDKMPSPPGGAAPAEELLEELEAALSDQLRRAQNDDFEGVLAAIDRLEVLLGRAGKMPEPLPPGCVDRLKRIRSLRRRLGLALAQKKHELAGKLGQLRGGKKLLRAYGN